MCCRIGQCVQGRRASVLLWWAARAQNGSSTEQQAGCHKPNVDGCSQLPLQHLGHPWVVEVPDDGVGCPGHGHHGGEGPQAEDGPRAEHDPSLDPVVAQTIGAASSEEEDQEAQTAQEQADTDEAARRLQVRRQVQQGVVKLALHLTCVLTDASHPQSLPEHLHDHQVGADERRHLPHGQSADQDGPGDAGHGQADAELLQSHGTRAGVLGHTKTDTQMQQQKKLASPQIRKTDSTDSSDGAS